MQRDCGHRVLLGAAPVAVNAEHGRPLSPAVGDVGIRRHEDAGAGLKDDLLDAIAVADKLAEFSRSEIARLTGKAPPRFEQFLAKQLLCASSTPRAFREACPSRAAPDAGEGYKPETALPVQSSPRIQAWRHLMVWIRPRSARLSITECECTRILESAIDAHRSVAGGRGWSRLQLVCSRAKPRRVNSHD